MLDSAVTGSRICLVACGLSVCSTDVPSYAAASMPLGVLRRSMCSGGLDALAASEACELYEACLDSGKAYCWGGGRWARLRLSEGVAWRKCGGCGWDGDWGGGGCCRTMVMMQRSPATLCAYAFAESSPVRCD
jgi:hypothetical protein